MKYLFTFLIAVCISALQAQSYTGKIVDENKQALPFVNVYWKGTTAGTSSNLEGKFTIPANASSDSLVFRMVGYRELVLPKAKVSSVQLQPDVVNLKTVEIKVRKKDPAYDIIKKTIKRRKFHLEQVEAYTADIYMKSRMDIVTIPELFLKQMKEDTAGGGLKPGVFSVSESVTKIAIEKPNNVKEEMIASKVSGTPFGQLSEFSWNRAEQVLVNFYEPVIPFSERGIISPIAPTALAFYDYKLLGFYVENGNIVNKIQVIPKRAADQVFIGEIYIIEDQWAIHSLNLKVRSTANIPMIDSVLVTQNYAQVEPEIWMPLALSEDFYFNLMGIKIRYIAQGNINQYNIHPTFPENYFSKEIFKVDNETKKNNDSLYWEGSRPSVLMDEEQKTYEKGDSIMAVINSPAYRDSLDRKGNKFKVMDLVTGYTYRKSVDSMSVSIPGLLSLISFNTVDGWVPYLQPTFNKTKNNHQNTYKIGLGYAEARDKLMGDFKYSTRRNRVNYLNYSVYGGYRSSDINSNSVFSEDINTYFTYFRERNFTKFYNQMYFGGDVGREIATGLFGSFGAKWSQREALDNNSTAVFKNFDDRSYTPNIPSSITTKSRTVFGGLLRYTPFQKYSSYPDHKAYASNPWPTLSIAATFATKAIGDAQYLKMSYTLNGHLNLKQFGRSNWSVNYTNFPNKDRLSYIDFHQFNGNQTAIYKPGFYNYHYLPFYAYATNSAFAQVSFEHNFNGFIWNKLPLLKKLPWRTLVGLKHIEQQNNIRYSEVYFGIDRIFQVLRIDAGFSIINKQTGPFKVQIISSF